MKTLSALVLLAAPFAFVVFPLSFEVSMSLAFAAGFAAIALTDYSRANRRLLLPAHAATTISPKERFGLAA